MTKSGFRVNIYVCLMNESSFWMNCWFLHVICEYQQTGGLFD